jgi:hypothetical protein
MLEEIEKTFEIGKRMSGRKQTQTHLIIIIPPIKLEANEKLCNKKKIVFLSWKNIKCLC